MSERIAKFLARSGVCSRRKAEELILQQRITVNGEVVTTPAFTLNGDETVLFDGEKIQKKAEKSPEKRKQKKLARCLLVYTV